MLFVRAAAAPSPIHGLGLFAQEPIPRGTIIWQLTPGADREFTPAELEALDPEFRERIRPYLYVDIDSGLSVLCGDDARYMNHAGQPNTSTQNSVTTALRDIAIGEELTADYAEFDAISRDRKR